MAEEVIVGSLSQDLVVKTPRRPQKGETIRGTDFGMFAGGKGNNQALSAARAGAKVAMVGRVGNDQFAGTLIDMLKKNNVDAEFVLRDPDVGTGIAVIIVDGDGDNSIVIAQQSNLKLCEADVEKARATIEGSKILLMQLEVPVETDIAAAKVARQAGVVVALNPAPAPSPEDGPLPVELLANVDIFIPNQTEAEQMCGVAVTDVASAREAAKKLRSFGPSSVIITMGEQGAFLQTNEVSELIPTFPVKAIDTTAAGDAFCGALAAAIARGESIHAAVRWGCAAGALATTKMGAEPSLPTAKEISNLVSSAALA